MDYKVKIIWDQDAGVWVATSNDIPGLVLESSSLDELHRRLHLAIPELLVLNHVAPQPSRVSYHSEMQETILA